METSPPRLLFPVHFVFNQTVETQLSDEAENERRSRCFVIHGLPELETPDEEQKRTEDWKAACDICNYLRVIKPDINGCRRMGQTHPRRCRPLMVELSSYSDVDTVLERAVHLQCVEDTKNLELVRARSLQVERDRMTRTSRPRQRDNPRYHEQPPVNVQNEQISYQQFPVDYPRDSGNYYENQQNHSRPRAQFQGTPQRNNRRGGPGYQFDDQQNNSGPRAQLQGTPQRNNRRGGPGYQFDDQQNNFEPPADLPRTPQRNNRRDAPAHQFDDQQNNSGPRAVNQGTPPRNNQRDQRGGPRYQMNEVRSPPGFPRNGQRGPFRGQMHNDSRGYSNHYITEYAATPIDQFRNNRLIANNNRRGSSRYRNDGGYHVMS